MFIFIYLNLKNSKIYTMKINIIKNLSIFLSFNQLLFHYLNHFLSFIFYFNVNIKYISIYIH